MKNILMCLLLVITLSACASLEANTPHSNKLVWTDIVSVKQAEVVIPKATTIKIAEAVMFDFDKFNIRDDQIATLDRVVALMNEYPDTVLALDGFASEEGTDAYNLELSQDRVESVTDYITESGIAADRIVRATANGETVKFGKLLLNRRVIVLAID